MNFAVYIAWLRELTDIRVAQLAFEDLSRAALGQGVQELDSLGHLEVCEPRATGVDDSHFVDGHARLEHNERRGHLAPGRIGYGDDRALEHVGVAIHGRFDFDRRNVLAARNDDVLLSIDDEDVAVRIDRPDVAGVKPAVHDDVRRLFRLVPIAFHNRVAARANFSGGYAVVRQRPALLVEYLDRDARQRQAGGRAEHDRSRYALKARLERGDGQHRRRLRKAVAAHHRAMREPRIERGDEARRRSRATEFDASHRRKVP